MFIWRSTGNCAGRDRSIDRSILFAAEPTTSRGRETLEGAAAAVESISFSCKSLLIYVVERASERGMCSRLQYNGLLTLASSCLLQATATAPLLPHTIQGSAKRLRPGLVNMRRKNCVLLPAAGKRTQYFHLMFTKPGRSLLAEPCSASFSYLLFKCWGPALQLPISIIWEQWMQQCKPSSSLNQKTWTL